jgi:hypothetical protein
MPDLGTISNKTGCKMVIPKNDIRASRFRAMPLSGKEELFPEGRTDARVRVSSFSLMNYRCEEDTVCHKLRTLPYRYRVTTGFIMSSDTWDLSWASPV